MKKYVARYQGQNYYANLILILISKSIIKFTVMIKNSRFLCN